MTKAYWSSVACVAALAAQACATPAPGQKATASPPPDCSYDRAAMLALSPVVFDQDLDKGWRAIGNRMGCAAETADLIAAYRGSRSMTGSDLSMNRFHEAQLRAEAGQYERAIPLFEQTLGGFEDDPWDLKVQATIAFLRRDRATIEAIRTRLAARPKPPGFDEMVAIPHYPGFPLPKITWPPYLDEVDGLLRCFDEPYAVAYGCNAPSGS